MKTVWTILIMVIAACVWPPVASAQPAAASGGGEDKRPKLGVADVKMSPSLAKAVTEGGSKLSSLKRCIEAIDGQMIDRLHNTRKFRVIARNDLDAVFKEQNFVLSGNVDTNDKSAAQSFKIAGIEYLVVTTIDDFQDYEATMTFTGTGETARKRIIRLGGVSKLYHSTTGELLESVSLQLGPDDPDYKLLRDIGDVKPNATANGDMADRLLVRAALILSDRVANRVIDVLYPAKVVAKTGKQVTINRGDGTGIAPGQVWLVYALGEKMIDPDTGKSLGAEEVQVGKVRITDVQPLFARAEILDDGGIDKLQILRMAAQQPAPPR